VDAHRVAGELRGDAPRGRRPGAVSGVAARTGGAWRRLSREQRLAVVAALLLLLSMLLPWYQETGNAIVDGRLTSIKDSKNAFQVYSFVEAAIFLVAAGVLVLMFARGERRAFHLPGGDGVVVVAAGLWVMFLVFYRQLDKPDGRQAGPISTSVGVEWGIFVAFLLGALLAYAGYRILASHVPEPAVDNAPPPRRPQAPPGPAPEEGATAEAPTRRDATDVTREAPTRPVERRPPADWGPFDEPVPPEEPAEYHPPPRRRRRTPEH
jgi:hypothetical protein